MNRQVRIFVALAVWLLAGGASAGAADPPGGARKIIVGTKHAPPFAIKGDDGAWRGVSIDLWRQVADQLKLEYELREFDLAGLLKGVEAGAVDAAVAAVTVTADRERVMDFTHPICTTGLSVAVVGGKRRGWMRAMSRVFSREFLTVVAVLVIVLLAVGLLVWLFERRRNPEQFGGGLAKGIGSGFWWSAVTMTTVGYGDKAPRTFLGRLVALVWMFTALVIIATFTGALASALTVGQLEAAVRGPEDLPKVRVGTVANSTSASYLAGRRIAYRGYPTALAGLRSLAGREIDAFVYDGLLLRYLVKTEMPAAVEVLPATFQRQDYAIALPAGSGLREPINRVLLEKISRPEWQETLARYLGK